jgi:hypothetical protein
MAHIPEAELERLKHDISLERLAAARGIALKPSGKNLMGLCPFHDDHEPSLSIDPGQNLWHCFGCQQGRGVIDWVMKAEGVSFRHAVELLRQGVASSPVQGSEASSSTTHARIVKHSRVPKLAVPLPADADAQHWARYIMEDYHTTLKDRAPEGKAYLAKHGLLNEALIHTFKLGFANRRLGYRLPRMATTEGTLMRGTLQQLGYLRPSGHEHFRGCLTVPILDADGHVTKMYSRRVTHTRAPGQPVHLYLPGPHKGAWNLAAFPNSQDLILYEAALDACTFWVHGFQHVTFSYGVDGFTADHLTALQQHNIQRVLIAYDAAGDRAIERGAAAGVSEREPPAGDRGRTESSGAPAARTDEQSARAITPTTNNQQLQTEIPAEQIVLTLGDRRYRIRGLQKNTSYERLQVNLWVAHGDAFHVDTLDLYAAKARAWYLKQAAIELRVPLDVLKHDLGQVLLTLEELHDQHIRQTLEPKVKEVMLSDAERTAALELLTDPHLLDRLLADFQRCGVVGEETNKLVGTLAAVSRLLDKPLAAQKPPGTSLFRRSDFWQGNKPVRLCPLRPY